MKFILKLHNGLIAGHADKQKLRDLQAGKLDGLKIDGRTYYRDEIEGLYLESDMVQIND